MSNHMIGDALSPILESVMELRESKELSDDTAERLIHEMLYAVGDYDGNYYEATWIVDRTFCGCCGARVPKGDAMYPSDYFIQDHSFADANHVEKKYQRFSFYLCEDCFKELVDESTDDLDAQQEITRMNRENYVLYSGDWSLF